MYNIKSMADIARHVGSGAISLLLARHFERKVQSQQRVLEPETPLEQFSLDFHGTLNVIEKSDLDHAECVLPKPLDQIAPEWVSCLRMAGETYYVLYMMVDNDCIDQFYLPDPIMPETVRLWLEAQPPEEESEECATDDNEHNQPFLTGGIDSDLQNI